jgi:hypothetical protein
MYATPHTNVVCTPAPLHVHTVGFAGLAGFAGRTSRLPCRMYTNWTPTRTYGPQPSLSYVHQLDPYTYIRTVALVAPHPSPRLVSAHSDIRLRRALEARRGRGEQGLATKDARGRPEVITKGAEAPWEESVDNLWITCGKLASHPPGRESYPQATPTYPQVIHNLSTTYSQVNT